MKHIGGSVEILIVGIVLFIFEVSIHSSLGGISSEMGDHGSLLS